MTRAIDETLDLAWDLLEPFSAGELKRIHAGTIAARRDREDAPQEYS